MNCTRTVYHRPFRPRCMSHTKSDSFMASACSFRKPSSPRIRQWQIWPPPNWMLWAPRNLKESELCGDVSTQACTIKSTCQILSLYMFFNPTISKFCSSVKKKREVLHPKTYSLTKMCPTTSNPTWAGNLAMREIASRSSRPKSCWQIQQSFSTIFDFIDLSKKIIWLEQTPLQYLPSPATGFRFISPWITCHVHMPWEQKSSLHCLNPSCRLNLTCQHKYNSLCIMLIAYNYSMYLVPYMRQPQPSPLASLFFLCPHSQLLFTASKFPQNECSITCSRTGLHERMFTAIRRDAFQSIFSYLKAFRVNAAKLRQILGIFFPLFLCKILYKLITDIFSNKVPHNGMPEITSRECVEPSVVSGPVHPVWSCDPSYTLCVSNALGVMFSSAHMDVSKNNGTPKSSILIGFSIINHPFWGTLIFGNTHMFLRRLDPNTFSPLPFDLGIAQEIKFRSALFRQSSRENVGTVGRVP